MQKFLDANTKSENKDAGRTNLFGDQQNGMERVSKRESRGD